MVTLLVMHDLMVLALLVAGILAVFAVLHATRAAA
jgi:hypothetical protein